MFPNTSQGSTLSEPIGELGEEAQTCKADVLKIDMAFRQTRRSFPETRTSVLHMVVASVCLPGAIVTVDKVLDALQMAGEKAGILHHDVKREGSVWTVTQDTSTVFLPKIKARLLRSYQATHSKHSNNEMQTSVQQNLIVSHDW